VKNICCVGAGYVGMFFTLLCHICIRYSGLAGAK
jgi:hypothetical protein